jgi:hypothetical protein
VEPKEPIAVPPLGEQMMFSTSRLLVGDLAVTHLDNGVLNALSPMIRRGGTDSSPFPITAEEFSSIKSISSDVIHTIINVT